jgi:hypothetical protein
LTAAWCALSRSVRAAANCLSTAAGTAAGGSPVSSNAFRCAFTVSTSFLSPVLRASSSRLSISSVTALRNFCVSAS